MNKTEIAWTDLTWNPVTGCTKVSPGCDNCYAEALSRRFGRSFEVQIHPERLAQVRKIPAGKRVFVNSMSDFFHQGIPKDFRDAVIQYMGARPDVEFQVLTKRPQNAHRLNLHLVPPNIRWGVSVENQGHLWRIREAIRQQFPRLFVSFEPLLGPIDLPPELRRALDWGIIGGESGPHRRPMNPEWAINLTKNLKDGGIPVFVKQMGGLRPGGNLETFPPELRVREFPAAIAGVA